MSQRKTVTLKNINRMKAIIVNFSLIPKLDKQGGVAGVCSCTDLMLMCPLSVCFLVYDQVM